MPTYVYETIPTREDEQPTRFELKQSMSDAPLAAHPETGQPIKRVISGGYGFNVSGGGKASPAPAHSCGGPACGCHN